MAELLPLFSTPVYTHCLNPEDFDFSLIEKISLREVGQGHGYVSENQNVLELQSFKKFKEEILKCVEIYVYDILKISKNLKLKCSNSWTCFYEKSDYSESHIHSNSLFSCVFYTHVDEKSSPLVFSIPRQMPTFCNSTIEPTIDEWNIFNSKRWRIHPSPGTIVIFPSTLAHSVGPSDSDTLRRCIASNYILTGKFGSPTQYLEIN